MAFSFICTVVQYTMVSLARVCMYVPTCVPGGRPSFKSDERVIATLLLLLLLHSSAGYLSRREKVSRLLGEKRQGTYLDIGGQANTWGNTSLNVLSLKGEQVTIDLFESNNLL